MYEYKKRKNMGTISANFSQDTFPCCHVAEKNIRKALRGGGILSLEKSSLVPHSEELSILKKGRRIYEYKVQTL